MHPDDGVIAFNSVYSQNCMIAPKILNHAKFRRIIREEKSSKKKKNVFVRQWCLLLKYYFINQT